MPRFVALLRGINVVGRNMVSMSELREFAAALGLGAPATLLQSGNLVFDGKRRSAASLERLLEKESAEHFDAAITYIVRSAADWQTIIENNPFPEEAKSDPSHLLMMALKSVPSAKDVAALEAAIKGPEYLRAVRQQLYVVYPAGIGQSKLTHGLIEKKLGTRGTGRNWNTVLKLGEMLAR